MSTIVDIRGRQILDSRGNPTVEVDVTLSDGTTGTAYRYHVRSPSFINLTALEQMCLGHNVADVVGILGSLDIVLGEVDR